MKVNLSISTQPIRDIIIPFYWLSANTNSIPFPCGVFTTSVKHIRTPMVAM
ncbi:hypothetical protein CYCME_1456 [Cycloclasticus zancles 78-ME]|uniref:Uncharacterized protein n=1 Tax=Cycloclasticus zancles 78-ME TaxID=1198232 RepID=S5T871_9GAMM|nr:hypothetical protein CYCME_1456 [Cycloclasticus zancles 78-ME]